MFYWRQRISLILAAAKVLFSRYFCKLLIFGHDINFCVYSLLFFANSSDTKIKVMAKQQRMDTKIKIMAEGVVDLDEISNLHTLESEQISESHDFPLSSTSSLSSSSSSSSLSSCDADEL